MYLPAAVLFGLGVPELAIILVIILVLFGPKKLPEIGKALGSTMRELRKSSQGEDKEKVEEVQAEVVEEKDKAAT